MKEGCECHNPNEVEVDWADGAHQIDDCEYLFVVSLREIEELTLELLLAEAKPQAAIEAIGAETPVELLKVGGRPIEPDPTCRTFQLVFDAGHMVSYTVLNESYGVYPEPPEEFSGKLFRIFSRSHLLDFTKRTTCASDEYPGILQHYEIACLNHLVDIICTEPPKIWVRTPVVRVH